MKINKIHSIFFYIFLTCINIGSLLYYKKKKRQEVKADMRKTKIVCTLGPATDKDNVLEELIKNGLNVARCNFSHGSHEEHLGRINKVKELREKCNKPVAILLDTKGPGNQNR